MSADNGIYILGTVTSYKKEGNAIVHCGARRVYRVAHAQAIDNLEHYKNNEPHNLGAYMVDVWGKSEVYDDRDAAIVAADKLASKYDILEYGISFIDTNLVFYHD